MQAYKTLSNVNCDSVGIGSLNFEDVEFFLCRKRQEPFSKSCPKGKNINRHIDKKKKKVISFLTQKKETSRDPLRLLR